MELSFYPVWAGCVCLQALLCFMFTRGWIRCLNGTLAVLICCWVLWLLLCWEILFGGVILVVDFMFGLLAALLVIGFWVWGMCRWLLFWGCVC